MARYTLYCAPDTYAMCAHAVLEEVSADYKVHWVELFTDDPDTAFLAASPHCRTPALLGPDGTVFETGAVALYVAEHHPGAGLFIAPGDPRRGTFLQWFHYLASTLQPEVLIQYHPEFYHDDPAAQTALRAASMTRLALVFDTLNAALSEGPYFFGDHPTVPDFILGTQALWDVIFPGGDITRYPNIARQRHALSQRASVASMLAQHRAEAARRSTQDGWNAPEYGCGTTDFFRKMAFPWVWL